MNRFADRSQGGAALAKDLAAHLRTLDHPGRPLVLALPRGGVPVGFQVAKALDGELDITVARKIGLPGQQEYGVGAVTPDGPAIYDHAALDWLGLSPRALEPVERRERAEARRLLRYRHGRPEPDVAGRVVIVVDDGLATGVTARAAQRRRG